MVLLPSCGPTYSVVTGYIDYSKYSDQGFFITEAPTVPFDYTPIGSMSVTEYSGKDKEYVVESVQTDKEYNMTISMLPTELKRRIGVKPLLCRHCRLSLSELKLSELTVLCRFNSFRCMRKRISSAIPSLGC